MSQEQAPAPEHRYILRRVHKDRCTKTEPIEVLRGGFCPAEADRDGLSVYFEDQVHPALLAAYARKPLEAFVVRLPLKEVLELGFTVVPQEDPDGPPGHALIPELSFPSYEGNKKRWKPLQQELARLASNNIVHRPGDPLPEITR
jgi:hypothetical protein